MPEPLVTEGFTEEELHTLKLRAQWHADCFPSGEWKYAFLTLMQATDYLHAMFVRRDSYEEAVEELDGDES